MQYLKYFPITYGLFFRWCVKSNVTPTILLQLVDTCQHIIRATSVIKEFFNTPKSYADKCQQVVGLAFFMN